DGAERCFPSRRLGRDGLAAHRLAVRRGFEGLVGKDERSPYREGRSSSWRKVKITQRETFVVDGYTRPAGTRPFFGALLLGAYAGPELRYVGRVGTGFSHRILAALHRGFQAALVETPPFVDPP